MRKSILQNSKDMLHKSFKPAKCKTSLKLASARLKLLKNKKEVQVKQLKRELAQLLESGQVQTARIRVEHVIREEKMMAAYDLIEIYCELVVARMPIIESQKSCPIDLKEAIASIIFATPRCGDIAELLDVKKHFAAKYGKEFVTAATELRPNCGVSRMLVEKLSATAPDGQTKLKILTAIAEEHNVNWDPNTFGDNGSTTSNDLLSGPSALGMVNEVRQEVPHFSAQDMQAPPVHDQIHRPPPESSEQSARSSVDTQHFASTQTGGSTTPAASHPEVRHSGDGIGRAEWRHSFDDNEIASPGRQKWNMDFKDATSAAQVAAESAELASMAARAAAELSSRGRITRQRPPELQKSSIHGLGDERSQTTAASRASGNYFSEDLANSSFSHGSIRLQDEQVIGSKHDSPPRATTRIHQVDHGSMKKSGHSAFAGSKSAIDDDSSAHGSVEAVDYTRGLSSEKVTCKAEVSMKNSSENFESKGVGRPQDGFEYDDFDHFEDQSSRKQHNLFASPSQSKSSDDDNSVLSSKHQYSKSDDSEGIARAIEQGSSRGKSMQMSSHDPSPLVFDESDLDDDNFKADLMSHFDERDSGFYLPSSGRKSPSGLFSNTDARSPKFDTSKPLERSESPSDLFAGRVSPSEYPQSDDNLPVTFDDSDGSGDDITKGGFNKTMDSENSFQQNQRLGSAGSSFSGKGNTSYEREPLRSSSGELATTDAYGKTGKRFGLTANSPKKFSFGGKSRGKRDSHLEVNDNVGDSTLYDYEEEADHLESRSSSHSVDPEVDVKVGLKDSHEVMKNDGSSTQSSSMQAMELNFELRGGLRHKGYTRPPYIRSQVNADASSSFKKADDKATIVSPSFDSPESIEPAANEARKTQEESSAQESAHMTWRKPYRQAQKANKNIILKGSTAYPDSSSDSDSSEEESKHQTRRKPHPYTQTGSEDIKLKGSKAFFGSDSSGEESTQQTGRKPDSYAKRARGDSKVKGSKAYFASDNSGEESTHRTGRKPDMYAQKASGDTNLRGSKAYFGLDSSGEESTQRTGRKPDAYAQKASEDTKLKGSKAYFDSDSSDSENGPHRKSLDGKNQIGSGISRRTKAPEATGARVRPEAQKSSIPSTERKTSRTSYSSERSQQEWPRTSTINPEGKSELSSPAKAASKQMPESKISSTEKSRKLPEPEEVYNLKQKKETSGTSSNPNTPTKNAGPLSKEDSFKRASHVHPKLPDYDTLAARMQSLRMNKQ